VGKRRNDVEVAIPSEFDGLWDVSGRSEAEVPVVVAVA